MTYNEKKSIYESIMKDIAKTVKRQLNEAGVPGFKDGDLISKEDAEQIARDRDIAARNNDWNEFFKKYPKLLDQIKNIGKPKYSTLAPANSNLQKGWFVGKIFVNRDRPSDKDIYFVSYGIKGNSYDETMLYNEAFVQSNMIDISDKFYKSNISEPLKKEWMQWHKNISDEIDNQIDEVASDMYFSCIEKSDGILDVAEKMKAFAEKVGFKFVYKVYYKK